MIRYLAGVRRVAVFLVGFFLSAQLAPSVALACEGAAEEQKISVTAHEWYKGGACATKENAKKEALVNFNVEGQWCEYEIENKNLNESVEIKRETLNSPNPECVFAGAIRCTRFIKPKGAECKVTLVLKKTEKCFDTIEYQMKPKTTPQEPGFEVETLSAGGGKATPTAKQIVE
ncbi:MAG TPA: hypothetical protein VK790_10150 [Solirubrobacteraceae bacterium]|nr:hypothetical protein [Solirubrobacteraceae bacterium]